MKWLDLQNFVKECKHKVLKIYILPSFIIVKEPAGVAQTCSVKKLFLEVSQNSQENTCGGVSILIKLQASVFSSLFPSLKQDSHLPKKFWVICLIESPSKVMKNAFYFILKAPLVLKIFQFLSRLFGHVGKNNLIRKIGLISKLMMPQPGLQTIAIHILPNISQSKGNQTMEYGQLIENNKINYFLQKLCGK